MHVRTPETVIRRIEQQIKRFGLHESPNNRNGLCVYEDDGQNDLPPNVLRLEGDGERSIVWALETIEALEQIEPCEDFEENQKRFYNAIVHAPLDPELNTSKIHWRDLNVAHDGFAKRFWTKLGSLADDAIQCRDTFGAIELHENGSIKSWQDCFVFADNEEPDWDTPNQPVDWTGFAEIVANARHNESVLRDSN
jgi:hypothetical protein